MNDLIITEKPERWVHYSNTPDQIVMYDCKQDNGSRDMGFKPYGLWITPDGVDDNWHAWATGNDFDLERLNYVHDVAFSKTANLLRISSVEGLDAFSNEYAMDTFVRQSWMEVDWPRLATKYDGILITPYIWARRLERFLPSGKRTRADWYYTWDCASGCIWNAKAIESITLRSNKSAGNINKPRPSAQELLDQLKQLQDSA